MKDYEDGVFGYDGKSKNGKTHSGGGGGRSFAIGLDYVPYDGFLAELHKGETILDAHTADEYRRKGLSSTDGTNSVLEIKLSGSIDGMNEYNQNKITNAVVQQIKTYLGTTATMNQLANNVIRIAN